jgi:hypothetical protein
MGKIKYCLRNINLLNLLLIAGAFFFMNYTVLPLFHPGFHFSLPAVKINGKDRPEEIKKTGAVRYPSPADYINVAEKNLFHPDRKIPVEIKKGGEEAAPLPKPELVLYGTLITDDFRLAYLEDLKAPRNTPGRGKRQTALKQGDIISGFTLKEIDADKITLQRGEEKMVVTVHATQRQPVTETPSAVSKTSPHQPPAKLPQQSRAAARRAKTENQQLKLAAPGRSRQGITQGPLSPEEQTLFDFLDKNRKKP